MATKSTSEMPFLDHLEELRWRIIWSLGALIVGMILGWTIVTNFDLLRVLQEPIAPYLNGQKLKFTHPADTFSITLSAALIVGAVIAAPVILFQIWSFLSPALHKHERRVAIPVLAAGVGLFVAGASLAYFYVLPLTLRFLMNFQSASLEAMILATDYFSLVMVLTLVFGATFELPLLIVALAAMGLVTPEMLSKFRPYAIVVAFLFSAIVTPGDIILASIALTIPLYLLYEISAVITAVIFRRRRKAQMAAELVEPKGLM